MTKKLYAVSVEFTYYALADSERDAESYCRDAFDDVDSAEIASANEVVGSTRHIEWPGDSLVYGADKDTTLDSALASIGLPSAKGIKAAAWSTRLSGHK